MLLSQLAIGQCQISITSATPTACDDNGTPSDPSDDIFSVILNASVVDGGASNSFEVTTDGFPLVTFTYGVGGSINNLPANGSLIEIVLTDSDDPTCSTSIEFSQSSCSDECELIITEASTGLCNDNGTPSDSSDDTFSIIVNASALNPGPQEEFIVSDGLSTYGPFPYNAGGIIPGLSADASVITFTFSDANDNGCASMISASQSPCSDECEIIINQAIAGLCDNNGTPADPTDDTFTAIINVSAINGFGTFSVQTNTGMNFSNLPYDVDNQLVGLPANSAQILITVTDDEPNPPTCQEQITIQQSSCSNDCELTITQLNIGPCNNNGTANNPSDDIYNVTFNISAVNSGLTGQYIVNDGVNTFGPFDYGVEEVLANLPTSEPGILLTFTDLDNPNCSTSAFVDQAPCSLMCEIIINEAILSNCDDNGTPNDPVDDTFNLSFNVSVNDPQSNTLNVTSSFGLSYSPQNFDTDITITAPTYGQDEIVFYFWDSNAFFNCVDSVVLTVPCQSNCIDHTTEITHVSACGTADATIDIIISSGVAPFTFDWNDLPGNDDPEDRSNLSTGDYSLTIQDSDGCTEIQNFTIFCPPQIENIWIDEVFCFDECNGEANIVLPSQGGPFIVEWPNGMMGPNANGLCPGIYSVTITNPVNQSTIETVSIDVAPQMSLTISSTAVSCMEDGSATAIVSGGTPAYVYLWSPSDETTSTINDLVEGVYTVTVVDANGCTAVASTIIDSPFDLSISSTDSDCDNNTGTATLNISGDVVNPIVEWSNGADTQTITDLEPGGYSVTVTNADDGCFTHENIIVAYDPACFSTISGYVYNDDMLQTCNPNDVSSGFANVMVQLDNGDITFTNADGYYEFEVFPGTYTISLQLSTLQYEFVCADPITVTIASTGEINANNNFFLKYGDYTDLDIKVVKGNARPGFEQWVRVCAMNHGDAPMNGTVTMVHDAIQTFVDASPAQSTYDIGTQTIVWEFTNLQPGQIFVYYAYLYLAPTVEIGTELNFTFNIDPVEFDDLPENNMEVCTEFVTGSYDPNDKNVSPMGEESVGYIDPDVKELTYTIRFQNTGNDTAFTVVLLDTLDANLNLSTIVPLPSEDDYQLKVLADNVLEFTFENILLPDSTTNEPESHGFVMFRIGLNDDLPHGTEIRNSAAIYFDYNQPIVTNETLNTVRWPDPVWPGNANDNTHANHFDLLHIGLGFNQTGPARPDATSDWVEQYALDWEFATPVSLVNYKHADCDGNGVVDVNDIAVLENNWGEENGPVEEELYSPDEGADFELYLELESLTAGQAVSVPVMLGTADLPANDIYGLAFSISYDSSLIQPGSVNLIFDNSWLGTLDIDLHAIQNDSYEEQTIYAAMTRSDGVDLDGQGQIARLEFIIQDDILLLNSEDKTIVDLMFEIEHVKMIDAQENMIPINYGSSIAEISTAVKDYISQNEINLFPNPAKDELFFKSTSFQSVAMKIYDLNGVLIANFLDFNLTKKMDISFLKNGIYIFEIETEKGLWQDKLLILD